MYNILAAIGLITILAILFFLYLNSIDRKKEEEKETEKDNDDDGYEKICLICHRPESVAGKMIEMPNHITVCRDCMQRSFDAMTDGSVDLSRLVKMPGV